MLKTQELITIDDCIENPQSIYVFGDNLIGKGKAGQAQIRGCPNAFGVPTKRKPSMSKDADKGLKGKKQLACHCDVPKERIDEEFNPTLF